MITGIHHIALKCKGVDAYNKTVAFYRDTLKLPVRRVWDGGIMLDTGAGLLEIFPDAENDLPQGAIRHFALATDNVDAVAKAVEEAGYDVFMKPTDICIPSSPVFPARICFCHGPVGEEIEFFEET